MKCNIPSYSIDDKANTNRAETQQNRNVTYHLIALMTKQAEQSRNTIEQKCNIPSYSIDDKANRIEQKHNRTEM